MIYGIALADLFSEWKRLFDFKNIYLPYALFTIVLTETALYNVFVYAKLIHSLEGICYYRYLIYLLPPFLFMLTTNIFTPDKCTHTRDYFQKRRPVFFTLLAMFITCHFLYDFDENLQTIFGRIIGIILILFAGYTRKNWTIYLVIAAWFILFLFRADMIST